MIKPWTRLSKGIPIPLGPAPSALHLHRHTVYFRIRHTHTHLLTRIGTLMVSRLASRQHFSQSGQSLSQLMSRGAHREQVLTLGHRYLLSILAWDMTALARHHLPDQCWPRNTFQPRRMRLGDTKRKPELKRRETRQGSAMSVRTTLKITQRSVNCSKFLYHRRRPSPIAVSVVRSSMSEMLSVLRSFKFR